MSNFRSGAPSDRPPASGDSAGTVAYGGDPPFTVGPDRWRPPANLSTVRAQTSTPPDAPPPDATLRHGNTVLSAPTSRPLTPSVLPPPVAPGRMSAGERIAAGGMGVVESTFDQVLLRRVARKTMHTAAGDQPDITLRFIEEAQITSQLDHPNIVPVHDLGMNVEQGKVFFTMKLVDGETLASEFRRLHSRPFSGPELERVLRMFLKVCDAVSFAHSRGVVHRDLKPDNIMIGSHGQVYVMDWGVALLMHGKDADARDEPIAVARPADELSGTIAGTVQFMAPEQAFGLVSDQGPHTDVYGLGAILYALLTGVGPSWAMSSSESLRLAMTGPIPHPETRPAWTTLPPGLCRIAMKALSTLPGERHPSVDALRQEVEEFLRGGGWFQTRSVVAGTVIVVEGDAADSAFVVTRGSCEVYRMAEGERRVVRRLGPGEIFGEMGLLTRGPRTASVVALDDVTVMVITPEALERELSQSGWLRELVGALASRFRELDQQLHASSRP